METTYNGNTKEGLNWKLYSGDASLTIQNKIKSNTIDCAITSPPYFWLRDYGIKEQIGLEDTIDDYINKICSVTNELQRVLKPSGLFFLNIGDTFYSGKGESQGIDRKSSKRRFGLRAVDKSGGMGISLKPKSLIGIPWRIALKMASEGWVLRSTIIWYRKHALPESVKDRPKRSYEFVFMFSKSKKYFFNKKPLLQVEQEDMWTITARPKVTKLGTAPFPDELVERCLSIGCPVGGTVLDPFVGSGTTMRVALENKINAVGIDLNKDFCEYVAKKLTHY